MKKIDFKSFLIGILSTLLCLLLLGSNSQKIISDEIICKKIIIQNDDFKDRIILSTDENGGKLQIKNKYGELINSLGASKNGNGFFSSYNNYGMASFSAGTGSNGNGLIKTFNKDGNIRTYIGSSSEGGLFNAYNNWDVNIAYMGCNKNQTGIIKLYNKHGETSWKETGEKK